MCHEYFDLVNKWCTSRGPVLLELRAAIVAHLQQCETCRRDPDHHEELLRWTPMEERDYFV
jgi:hypothetical protein